MTSLQTSTLSASIADLARRIDATMTAPTPPASGSGGESGSQGGGNGQGDHSAPAGGSTPPASAGQATGTEAQDVASLPEWARTHIANLRHENAGHRQAKTAAEQARETAEQGQNATLEAVKRALGLSEAPSADQLGTQLAQAQAETRQARIETAIARHASTHGADPAALLDSRSFLDVAAALDPTAADFSTKIGDAMKAAVAASPKLAAAAPATTAETTQRTGPAPDPSQASAGNVTPAKGSLEAGAAAYEARFGRKATSPTS